MTASASQAGSPLSGAQRKYLRGLAHSFSPVVHVGRAGVNENVVSATNRALEDHELIKVKIAATRDERTTMAAQLVEGSGSHLAGAIGTIAILYRPHRDPEKRRIVLPVRAAPVGPSPDDDPTD